MVTAAILLLPELAAAETYREFAKIPGETWTNAAFTADGKHLHHCTAWHQADDMTVEFRRDRTGYSLNLVSPKLPANWGTQVRLVAGRAVNTLRAAKARGADSVTIDLGKSPALIKRLTQAVYRKRADVLTVRASNRTLAVPLKEADGALVELETCWKNARP